MQISRLIHHFAIYITTLFLLASPNIANAVIYNFTYTGVFTALQSSNGSVFQNSSATANSWNGYRTDIAGTLSIDTFSGTGNVTVNPFDFLGNTMTFTSGNTVAYSTLFGDPASTTIGDLNAFTIGSFLFDYGTTTGTALDIVWDTAGFFDALNNGLVPGDIVSGNQLIQTSGTTLVNSANPASNGLTVTAGPTTTAYPIGPAPFATTTWDVDTGSSNGLPLTADTIGGSPQLTGALTSLSLNLDIGNAGSLHLVSVEASVVPIPAAVWLFGSGLIGLIGVARRKKA